MSSLRTAPGITAHGSPAAEQRLADQRRNHWDYTELDQSALAESVLPDDGVFEAELELRDQSTYPGCLRYGDTDGHVPFVAGRGPPVVGDNRTKADLPGIRQVVGHEVEQVHIARVGDVAAAAARSDSEEILGKDSHSHLLRVVADDHGGAGAPLP